MPFFAILARAGSPHSAKIVHAKRVDAGSRCASVQRTIGPAVLVTLTGLAIVWFLLAGPALLGIVEGMLA